jgi:hypothetical protein
MDFTMAYPNFKKGLKMVSGPLGVNIQNFEGVPQKFGQGVNIIGVFTLWAGSLDIPLEMTFLKKTRKWIPHLAPPPTGILL